MATVQVDLMHTSKARNSTRVPSTTEGHITETICYLKDPTSIIKPTLIIQGADSTFEGKQFPDYNYCYIKDFHRYYFITNVTSISALVWQIDCEVDVLATYRKEILATKAFVMYAQSSYNSMLPDSRLAKSVSSTDINSSIEFTPYSKMGTYVLNVVGHGTSGQNGFTATYAMTAAQLKALGDKLTDQSIWESLKKQLDNPLDYILNCVWMPIDLSLISGSSSTIWLGNYDTGISGKLISGTTVDANFFLIIDLPYHDELSTTYSDYRNTEPYTECRVFLPGVGLVQLPLIRILKSGANRPTIYIDLTIDITTGECLYLIKDFDKKGMIMTVSGTFGVDVPVASQTSNAIGALSGIGASIGAVAMAAALPETATAALVGAGIAAAGSVVSTATSVSQQFSHIKGGLGGRVGAEANANIVLTVSYWKISDTPSNCLSTIGLPLFKTVTLGSLSGLVKCSGAWVKAECTDTEHQMIAQYVNSSTNFIYGGLIIE